MKHNGHLKMEKINTDYKQRTWNIQAQLFKMNDWMYENFI